MIRCVVVDDEPLALMQLASYVSKIPDLQLVGQCSSAIEALALVRQGGVDLLFSDINMPDMSGLELVRQIGGACLVVFTTAYADYAIDGYKVEAVDYLLKPFGLADLVAAVEKAKRRLMATNADAQVADAPGADCEVGAPLAASDYVFVKSDFKMSRVRVADIAVVEGMSEYVRLYVADAEKPFVTLVSMKRIEAALPPDMFMRVHRSWIVNLSKVESVSHFRISIAGLLVPVSDNYKDRFASYLDSHALK